MQSPKTYLGCFLFYELFSKSNKKASKAFWMNFSKLKFSRSNFLKILLPSSTMSKDSLRTSGTLVSWTSIKNKINRLWVFGKPCHFPFISGMAFLWKRGTFPWLDQTFLLLLQFEKYLWQPFCKRKLECQVTNCAIVIGVE